MNILVIAGCSVWCKLYEFMFFWFSLGEYSCVSLCEP